jgi:hypothetical protein
VQESIQKPKQPKQAELSTTPYQRANFGGLLVEHHDVQPHPASIVEITSLNFSHFAGHFGILRAHGGSDDNPPPAGRSCVVPHLHGSE